MSRIKLGFVRDRTLGGSFCRSEGTKPFMLLSVSSIRGRLDLHSQTRSVMWSSKATIGGATAPGPRACLTRSAANQQLGSDASAITPD